MKSDSLNYGMDVCTKTTKTPKSKNRSRHLLAISTHLTTWCCICHVHLTVCNSFHNQRQQ